MTDYRDLIVWQKSMELAHIIYHMTSRFLRDEIFGLTNQMRSGEPLFLYHQI